MSTQNAVHAFVRDQGIRLLERALRTEANPDDRRILRRLLREQERIRAAENPAEMQDCREPPFGESN
jgi:hypothetical protein